MDAYSPKNQELSDGHVWSDLEPGKTVLSAPSIAEGVGLGHAAAPRGRVHVPHRVAAEKIAAARNVP